MFTSRHISENSLQHVTGEARAPIALHDEWVSGAKLSSQPTFSVMTGCVPSWTLSVVAMLSASVDAEFVSEMHRRLYVFIGLVVEQCSTSEPEDARVPL